jgi:hypothetical protein
MDEHVRRQLCGGWIHASAPPRRRPGLRSTAPTPAHSWFAARRKPRSLLR